MDLPEISSLSISQLKSLITKSGLSFSDCIEKSDLQSRALQAQQILKNTPEPQLPNTDGAAKLTDVRVLSAIGEQRAVVFWMHGLGDTADGWLAEMEKIQKKHFPYAKLILPTAPIQKVTINPMSPMTSWHDIENLQNLSTLKFSGIDSTKQSLQKLINSEILSGTPSQKIVLGGFSQGAAMALYTGLNYPQKLAGLVCFSGYLPKFTEFEKLLHESNRQTEVLMAHGLQDNVVDFKFGQGSQIFLKSLGVPVEMKSYQGMQHNTCAQEMKDLVEFLKKVIP